MNNMSPKLFLLYLQTTEINCIIWMSSFGSLNTKKVKYFSMYIILHLFRPLLICKLILKNEIFLIEKKLTFLLHWLPTHLPISQIKIYVNFPNGKGLETIIFPVLNKRYLVAYIVVVVGLTLWDMNNCRERVGKAAGHGVSAEHPCGRAWGRFSFARFPRLSRCHRGLQWHLVEAKLPAAVFYH